MTPLAPQLTAFFRERLPVQRGASPHTCDSYAYTFQLLLGFASQRLKVTPSNLYLEQLDAALVMEFLAHLETVRENGPRTRNARLAALKLHVGFMAGLRVSELTGLLLTAVTLQPTPTLRVIGKGRKERSLPLWKQTAADLRAWLAVRGEPPAPELFLNASGRPMTRMGFTYLLRKHVSSAAKACPSLREKRVSPHVLRHSCAMMIYQATGDLRKVALWLGHAQMQTTEIYLRADPVEKIEILEAVTPPSLRRGRFTVPDKLIASLRGA
jgi:site-specific recombinase XerC